MCKICTITKRHILQKEWVNITPKTFLGNEFTHSLCKLHLFRGIYKICTITNSISHKKSEYITPKTFYGVNLLILSVR
jgi:hypothetical protein